VPEVDTSMIEQVLRGGRPGVRLEVGRSTHDLQISPTTLPDDSAVRWFSK
jgi:hypothetical protein